MNHKTEWDLSVFYKNENDSKIEKDIKEAEKACISFEKKYRGKDYTSTSKKLLGAMKDYENLVKAVSGAKAGRYFYHRKDLNSEDNVAGAMLTKIDNRLTKTLNKLVFFDIDLSKIPVNKQKIFLADKNLAPYAFYLKKIFENAKHMLSEKEEQLASLLSQTSSSMWVDGQEKLLNIQTVEFKGENIPVPKAMSILADLPKDERHELGNKINQVLKSVSFFAESELNAVYNFKKVMDERRGFKTPYDSTLLSNHNDPKTIKILTDVVTKNFGISHRFYKLHAKLLKEKKLSVSDRSVKIGEIKKKFDYETSVKVVGGVFEKVGRVYKNIFDKIVNNSQVDVYPKKGKTGGAYCSGGYDVPTIILLNHTDDLRSLETLAHEMGHAVHTEIAKGQPVLYQDYSYSTAEVASTFFEQVTLSEIEDQFTNEEKFILLHNKIMGDISTIFRQIACFNFELELHNRIRREGQLSKEDIAKLLRKHLESYLGEAFNVTDDDGYYFVSWSHIRRFFYVYTYAYGQLISRALFENWKKDKKYAEKIEKFLSLGGSMTPEEIFKKVGINVKDPKFFESGLKSIEKDIEKLEKLTK
jgi:oligoendopeptidase F